MTAAPTWPTVLVNGHVPYPTEPCEEHGDCIAEGWVVMRCSECNRPLGCTSWSDYQRDWTPDVVCEPCDEGVKA